MSVSQRFDSFLANLTLTPAQRQDGTTKHTGVRATLNSHYYRTTSGYANSKLVGSWGKSTEIRPPRDIDILFVLPSDAYRRFEQRPGNKQSQLLQEVKDVLLRTYSATSMRADGQVVMVNFGSYAVEVLPAFLLQSGRYYICDTNNGGRYKEIDPDAEIQAVTQSESDTAGNTRHLIRMMKCWQGYCSVPMKSFWLELLAMEFLSTWPNKGKSTTWYDWMVRDFFAHMYRRQNGILYAAGTFEVVTLGNAWASRVETAYGRAAKACEYEQNSKPYDAGIEWQKIFGSDIPVL